MATQTNTRRALLALAVAAVAAATAAPAPARVHGAGAAATGPTGTWKRVLTQADIDRTASFRVEPEGSTPPPPGPVLLTVAKGTFTFTDGTGFSIGQTIRIGAGGAFDILTYVAPEKGAFCTADEPQNASYTWKLDGKALVLSPVDDRCADRNSILAGRWSRATVTRTLIATQTRFRKTTSGMAFSERLTEGGKPAGSDSVTCKSIAGAVSRCRVVLRLHDGTITLQGTLGAASSTRFAITQGTGAYAAARGSVVAKQRSDTVTELTLTLA
jgi:hypothetical protein